MSEFKYMEELDKKLENIKYKEKIINIEIALNHAWQILGYYKDSPIEEKINFINNALTTLINHIKNIKENKKKYNEKKIVDYYNKNIINKLKETINKEPEGLNKKDLNRLDELLPRLEEYTEQPKPEPEEEPEQPKPEEEQPKPEQSKTNYKEKTNKIYEKLNNFRTQSYKIYNTEYMHPLEIRKLPVGPFFNIINLIEQEMNNLRKKTEEEEEEHYNNIIKRYNKYKNDLNETIKQTPKGEELNKLKKLYKILPSITEPEPEPEPEPEQPEPEPEPEQPEPIKGINPTWTQPPLNERITRPNPDAPPTTIVSTTPIDDFTEPKQKKPPKLLSSSGSEYEEEEEEQQQPAAQQLVPVNNSQQIVQSPKENFKIAERDIEEFKNNPQLDIIKGVGDVIEFIATSNLTPEMTDELIDQMLDLKDSHGNLLFNNRFQIEDLIINRKKRRRLKYLLPKRIIRAEKPDEQKLIINPMLRRGRIASMTSAKERYYNYI